LKIKAHWFDSQRI